MELKEGMYVRFDNGIRQIEEVEEDWLCFDISFYDHWNELTYSMKYKEFIEEYKPKFSDKIIDLIECLDIVELYIIGLEEDNITTIKRPETLRELKDLKKYIKRGAKIKSITTKEQFENISYKVGE